MTTAGQKQRERQILDLYLQVIGINGGVSPSESPDFIIEIGARKFGVEITEYHQPTYPNQNFSRTLVEADWQKLRESVVTYRGSHSGLENLSVLLSFTELSVPRRNQRQEFIQAVHQQIEHVKPQLTQRFLTIRIDQEQPDILKQHLRKIDVCLANCYLEWDWNHAVAAVGTSEDELIAILRNKLTASRPKDIDELHLIIAGDGPTGGSYIGYIHPELLQGWGILNNQLEQSIYDAIAILSYRDSCLWRRGSGWSPLDIPNTEP